jgi:hypothetical protein
MDRGDVQGWFGAYLEVFQACGRGDYNDVERLLDYYNVPFVLTTDEGVLTLSSEADVVRAAQQQIDGMRAAGYDRSEVLESHVEVLNNVSAIYRGHLSRQRSDGSEIGRVRVTYLITDGSVGRRISALVVHSACMPSAGAARAPARQTRVLR